MRAYVTDIEITYVNDMANALRVVRLLPCPTIIPVNIGIIGKTQGVNASSKPAKKNNIIAGIHNATPEYAEKMIKKGFQLVTIGSDQKFIASGASQTINKIKIVFHAAAYNHVPLVEINPLEGLLNNIASTYLICKISKEKNADDIVLISSDKAVRPTNIMGASKRLSELIFRSFSNNNNNQNFSMVRFGNVIGSSGSVVPLFKKQIANGGPVKVTHKEIIRYFMSINEAVSLILNATYFAKRFEIFMLKMGEQVKIVDLAKKIINLSGKIYTFDNLNKMQDEVKIEFIGLSKGEKIEEDLFEDENFQITDNSNILILNNSKNSFKFENFENDIKKLFKSVNVYDQKEVVSLINKIKNKNYLE